jgi:serine/threonine protein kinase
MSCNSVGILKVLDFGLAREVIESDRTEDGLYRNMTGCTGAVRYMAPENAMNKPYDLSTDTYSFAMVLWFVFALEPPFALYTEKMILDRVCQRGYRPKLFASWSPRLSKLISRCWSENPKDRPSFSTVTNELKKEMADIDPKYAQILEESEQLCLDGTDE